MKLSIVIPAYNVEHFLLRCVTSIIDSDLPRSEYEVIIVDDGSSDNTINEASELSKKYDNISVFSQTNQGQSVARNLGIREAKGEYIWCVDGDDYINSELLGIFDLMNSKSPIDIIAVQLTKVRENGDFVGVECDQPKLTHNVIMKGRDAIINHYNPSSVCALIIRRSFIEKNNLLFYEGITHQDVELSYRLMAHANDVIFTNYAPYIYVLHPNSTSQSLNPQKKIKYLSDEIVIINSFTKLAAYFEDSDPALSQVILERVRNIHFGMVLNLHKFKKKYTPLGINAAVLNNMRDAELYPIRCNFNNWKKNLFKILLNQKWFVQ